VVSLHQTILAALAVVVFLHQLLEYLSQELVVDLVMDRIHERLVEEEHLLEDLLAMQILEVALQVAHLQVVALE
jgi:hypothetical protein